MARFGKLTRGAWAAFRSRAAGLLALPWLLWASGCADFGDLNVSYPPEVPKTAVVQFRPKGGLDSILGFSPDGGYVVCRTRDGKVHVYSTVTGKLAAALPGWGVLAPGGRLLVHQHRTITVLKLAGDGPRQLFRWEGRGEVYSLALADETRLLAAGGEDSVYLWDIRTGAPFRTLTGAGGIVAAVAFSQNGKVLASAAGDGTVSLWDVAGGEKLRTIRGLRGDIALDGFSDDGKALVVRERRLALMAPGHLGRSLFTGSTLVFATSTGRRLLRLPDSAQVTGNRQALALPDGALKEIRVYTLSTGVEAGRVRGVGPVAVAPDSGVVAAGGSVSRAGRTIVFWDLPDRRAAGTCAPPGGDWQCAALGPGGKIVGLKHGSGMRMCLIDRRTGERLVDLDSSPDRGWSNGLGDPIVFSPDGSRAATRCKGEVAVLDLRALAAAWR